MSKGGVLQTALPGLELRPLTATDAPALHRLVAENATHLTAHGDYAELLAATQQAMELALSEASNRHLRFGLVVNGQLVGRLDLVPVEPPRYGIGYWLASAATGKGYATAAITAACAYARDDLGASDIFAGVTHGNHKSAAALERAGFRKVETFERYARFHLSSRT